MNKLKYSVRSMRLRTLPLSLSGVILGIALAASDYHIRILTVVFILITTVSLQILSNLSNELGDVQNGTDTSDRQGPEYGLNSGALSIGDMKRLILIFVIVSAVSGLLMIRFSFGTFFSLESLCLILLGAAAINAAMRYTLGKNPYGYRGLGDIYVFTFFGIVAVLGAYFVAAHTLSGWFLLLPASAIGLFSVGVLNVNNIRDMKTDEATRVTVALKLGIRNARIYQTVLIAAGWICAVVYCLFRYPDPWHYLFILVLPLFVKHLHGIWTRSGRELDPMLPLLVMSSFLFSLLFGLGFLIYLFR
ncbi:MAG: 1,4-dihydroxy-2-naphthoate octaprenyltransferase [Bacteroidales bacterium]|nr:1,4-dihydroxy-2-naphthoate octaprenyltransferase [Bacteroidales bacterium]MCI1784703.1 1,4-dihydroxy-2-naphthoate octaprenyltransferase [Bacteroidales bacterium]